MVGIHLTYLILARGVQFMATRFFCSATRSTFYVEYYSTARRTLTISLQVLRAGSISFISSGNSTFPNPQ